MRRSGFIISLKINRGQQKIPNNPRRKNKKPTVNPQLLTSCSQEDNVGVVTGSGYRLATFSGNFRLLLD